MLETLSLMGAGFVHALSPLNIILMIAATALGITIGCLPGLSAAMGVALLLPVTFGMDPATGLIVLGGIYCGAIFGGSISAILVHTPGYARFGSDCDRRLRAYEKRYGRQSARCCLLRVFLRRSSELYLSILLLSVPCRTCDEV